MADLETLSQITNPTDAGGDEPSAVPISAALGETVHWTGAPAVRRLPSALHYAKLGLAGLGGVSDWQSLWSSVRQRFDGERSEPLRWIAVVYADRQAAEAPEPESVIEAAARTQCAGVLFDTYSKRGGALTDCLTARELLNLFERAGRHGLLRAVAGGLSRERLAELAPLRPEIVAIRTAACRRADRLDRVDRNAVRQFGNAQRSCFAG